MKLNLHFHNTVDQKFNVIIDDENYHTKTIEIAHCQYQFLINYEESQKVAFTFMKDQDYLKNEQLKTIIYELDDPKLRTTESYVFDISAYAWNQETGEMRLITDFPAFSEILNLFFRGHHPVRIESAYSIEI